MASKKVTIKDVAREAGVSISTVSNALNDVDVLLPDTKQHILEVAKRLNYIPNINGRNLKAQATNVIGLFVNSVRGSYYGVLGDSIFRKCREMGYELNIFVSDNPETMMFNMLGKRVDGAIILNQWIREEQVELLRQNEIPTVFIDREESGPFISSVIFDSYHEGEQAAKYLLELGHKSFLFVQGVENNYDSIERERGFRQVLQEAGITLEEDYVVRGWFGREITYDAIKEFLKKEKPIPDAIFAANDESALGVIEALTESGIRVPEQVSVFGCDDIEMASRVHPSITTIRTSFENQGMRAVEHLIRMIKDKEEGKIEIMYGSVIPRESTQCKE